MIDLHSHILPNIDDGSQSIKESLSLLSMLSSQGVKTVAATPHFYAENDPPERFLERRNESYARLSSSLTDGEYPEILLGAEVRYYGGISRMNELSRFCIGNTDILLLEMPFNRWSKSVLKELRAIACSGECRVVLAHIERYISMQEKGIIDSLREEGILLQTNASFFSNLITRRKALKLLANGFFDFIGSDCHNTVSRPPRISEACAVIEKKLGKELLYDFTDYSKTVLGYNSNNI